MICESRFDLTDIVKGDLDFFLIFEKLALMQPFNQYQTERIRELI